MRGGLLVLSVSVLLVAAGCSSQSRSPEFRPTSTVKDIMDSVVDPAADALWDSVEARHPGLDTDRKVKALVRDGIGAMVGDVLAETRRRVAESGAATIDEVRAAGRALVGFSAQLQEEDRALKRFLNQRLYNSPALVPVRQEAQRVVGNLAHAYRADPTLLPDGWKRGEGETARLRAIGDFIAGMTDRFAIARHEELIGPVTLPDRF